MSNDLTRRRFLVDSGLTVAGASALAVTGPRAAGDDGGEPGRRLPWLLDMVHHNPGEPLTRSAYTDPRTLAGYGYGAQVVNEFRPPHTAITFDSLDPDIFPAGSDARGWVEENARRIESQIEQIHAAGLQAFYFTDIIVLPKRLVELYGSEILDSQGRVNFDLPRTQEIHRIMLGEVFDRFPELDGLVIRTGETYLQNVPYHTGNNPITRGAASHEILIGILRDEVCERRGKQVFYRTWSFDGFHTEPSYYLDVTDRVEPHPKLAFSIKHTQGDYWRTRPFNPTIGIGRHPQIVEVQCQREYEGKGACPNYVIDGVINGFEEFRGSAGPIGLADVADNPLIQGVWTWTRGGGWRGPYITNELWCDLNAWVIAHWAQDTGRSERDIFDEYARRAGLRSDGAERFRRLALLSAAGTLRGHYSTVFPLSRVTWTRDQFLGGSDWELTGDFGRIVNLDRVDAALAEKAQAAAIWAEIVRLAHGIPLADLADREYLQVSSRYGMALYTVIHHGWEVMLRGFVGDRSGSYDGAGIAAHARSYDQAWEQWQRLSERSPSCASLYQPYGFGPSDENGVPTADSRGMKPSVDGYRRLTRIELDLPGSVDLGAPFTLDVTVTNPSSNTQEPGGTLTLEVPAGWSRTPEEAAIGRLAAGESHTVQFEVVPPDATEPGRYAVTARASLGGVDYEVDQTLLAGIENVALGKPATQKSLYQGTTGQPERAVDGNTDGKWGGGSVTHTAQPESEAWWQVDIEDSRHIHEMALWNRTDCCSDRLSDYYVFVSAQPFTSDSVAETLAQPGVRAFYQEQTAGSPTLVPVDATGRHVRVQLTSGTDPLSLAEVEVMGRRAD